MRCALSRACAATCVPLQVYNYSCCDAKQGPGGIPPGDLSPSAWLYKTPEEFGKAMKWIAKR